MNRFLIAALAALLLATPVAAQSKTSPIFRQAAQSWNGLDPYQKVRLQVYLTAAGYWPAVPNQDFGPRLFEAMAQFQSDHGDPRTGMLTPDQIELLTEAADPILRQWGFREIMHPTRQVSIWAPLGLGLVQKRVKDGLEYGDPQGRISLAYKYLANVGVQEVHDYLLQQAVSDGSVVSYEVLRKDFFVVMIHKDGLTRYMRYHQDGSGLLGFAFAWNDAGAEIYGERIVTLISSSLYAVAKGAPFVTPPKPAVQQVANPPITRPTPPAPQPITPGKEDGKLWSGTGFFVTSDGYLLTNHHVIEKCTDVAVISEKHPATRVRVVAVDPTNDLALLKADLRSNVVPALRIGIKLGESVAAFGYPLSDVLSSSGNFTLGSVTATSGMRDDSRQIQIQAPVQSGNSGGPLFDYNGNVIGVVVAKLNAMKMVEVSGDMPQNVNFAIKTSVAASFLDSKGITFNTSTSTTPMPPEAIAENAKSISAMVVCK